MDSSSCTQQHVKNRCVIFDNTFNLYRQLSHITKLLNYQLHSLCIIHHSISIAIITASAYILTIFDYGNVILYNTTSSYINKLNMFHNSIARCIFKIPKHSHTNIYQFLTTFYWLPVRYRILYKTLTIGTKSILTLLIT